MLSGILFGVWLYVMVAFFFRSYSWDNDGI